MFARRIAALLSIGFMLEIAPPLWAGDGAKAKGKVEADAKAPAPATPFDEMKAKIAAAGDAEKHKADAVVVLDETDVLVRASGIGTARSHVVTKILKEAAIKSQAVQRFEYDPHTNRLELVAVRVYRKDGTVEELPLDRKTQQPQPAHGVFWGTQQYLVSVPRLNVGDAVETIAKMTGFNVAYLAAHDADDSDSNEGVALTADTAVAPGAANDLAVTADTAVAPDAANDLALTADTAVAPGKTGTGKADTRASGERNALGEVLNPPVPGNWHDEAHFFTTGTPIIEKRYMVRIPKNKPLQFGVYNGELRTTVMYDGDDMLYTFEKKDITPLTSEPSMEAWPNVGTKLLLATLPSWQDKSKWLYAVSEPQFTPDDAIKATVNEVIKNCKTDEEKFAALDHWVAENIRYAGTTRGMCEGYTIHDVKETFHDRAGVCKDKAGMLVGMLRVAGYDSFLVMTMARQRVDPVPADQFNHAVTCVRFKDGSLRLLDPTWMPKSRDTWSTLEPLQHVVYGLPDGKELSQSPYFPPEDCRATWKALSTINERGMLEGILEFSAVGAPEGRLRRSLAAVPPVERVNLFDETALRISPNATLTKVACTDPVDFSGPIQISGVYKATNFATGDGTKRFFALPMLRTPLGDRTLYDLFGNTASKDRKYGVKLMATRLGEFEETIKLPAGWKVTKVPDPVDIDGPSAGLHFKAESEPGQLKYTCTLVVKKWTVPPADYANFKEVIDKFEELGGRVVTCEVEGGHAQR